MIAELDFEGILYFGVSLDTISANSKGKGIAACASKVLGLQEHDRCFSGQPDTLKAFVQKLYDDGGLVLATAQRMHCGQITSI